MRAASLNKLVSSSAKAAYIILDRKKRRRLLPTLGPAKIGTLMLPMLIPAYLVIAGFTAKLPRVC